MIFFSIVFTLLHIRNNLGIVLVFAKSKNLLQDLIQASLNIQRVFSYVLRICFILVFHDDIHGVMNRVQTRKDMLQLLSATFMLTHYLVTVISSTINDLRGCKNCLYLHVNGKLKFELSADSNAYQGIHNICKKWYPLTLSTVHHSHSNQNHQNHSLQYLSDPDKYHLLQGDYECLLLLQLPDGICIRNSDLCLHIALHSSHLYQMHSAYCCFHRHSNRLPLVF